jgi:hypothetical protein
LADRGGRLDVHHDSMVDVDQRTGGSAGEMNFGVTSVAAPKAA